MKFVKIISREYSVQYTEMSLRSLRPEAKKHLPAFVNGQFYVPEDGNESCYMNKDEWQQFVCVLDKKYTDRRAVKKFIFLFHKYGKEYVRIAKLISRKNFSKLDNKDLAGYYNLYQKSLLDYSSYVWLGFLLNNIYSDKAKKILISRKANIDNDANAALFSPLKRAGILKLQNKIFKLKEKDGNISEILSEKILADYAWISCLDIQNEPWNKKDLNDFIANVKASQHSLSFEKAAMRAGLSKKEKGFFQIAKELAYVKDMRDEYRRRGIYSIKSFFDEIAGRANMDRKNIAYFSWCEIADFLKGERKLEKSEAEKRKHGFLIYCGGKNVIVTAEQAKIEKFVSENIESEKNGSGTIIRGIAASLGLAKGRAAIVLSVKDLPKVKDKDIMIAISTHPDFVPAMHKAAAIVTDEGGLTSHAAIVSRELGVPCVVGIKIATKVLKDGDMVEVDAEKRIVKILKKG